MAARQQSLAALSEIVDDLRQLVSGGERFEDAVRSVAMRRLGRDPDFQMSHRPPVDLESGASMSRITEMYPEDVYTRPRIYASTPSELYVADILRRVRDQDEAMVPIYRTVPRWVSDINPGEWVTPSPMYAREHAYNLLARDEPFAILEGQARARDLLTEGNSLAEFGYIGEPIRPAKRLAVPKVSQATREAALAGDPNAIKSIGQAYGLAQLL